MRFVLPVLVVLIVPGCSQTGGVRRPSLPAVAEWRQHIRDLNRHDPVEEEKLQKHMLNLTEAEQRFLAGQNVLLDQCP
jgi:hypothetical protein